MIRIILIVLIIILMLPIFLIVLVMSLSGTKREAEKIVEELFDAMQTGNFQSSLKSYADEFYRVVPRKKWLATLNQVQRDLGQLNSYQLKSWRVRKVSSSRQGGTFYELGYQVNYEKDTALEKFTLYKPRGSEEIKIMAHHIEANKLIGS